MVGTAYAFPTLPAEILYDYQYIHRFALPLKIGGVLFLVMITVKERIDHDDITIDEFAFMTYIQKLKNIKIHLVVPPQLL